MPADLSGWNLGLIIGIIVVVAVVALIVPILILARRIGKQAPLINEALRRAETNTAALAALEDTMDHAEIIVAGLARGRARLGG